MSSLGRSGVLLNLARLIPAVLLLVLTCLTPPTALAAGKATLGPGGPLPLTFEPNQGQADGAVRFLARGRGYGLFLSPTESVLVLTPPVAPANGRRPLPPGDTDLTPSVVRMRLVGAHAGATITGVDPLPGRSHYLIGDRSRWRRDVPTFARVRYSDVYPGVSLVFYGNDREIEYDFVVAPGADPSAVVLAFEGADTLRIDDDGGDLVLATAAGELRLRRPLIYQETGGERRRVDGGYVLEDGRVRFRVAAWDPARPLVIDPVLGYSTYLGGTSNDQGFGLALDDAGNAYVTGSTVSSNFPVSVTPIQGARNGVTDVFITKIDSSGSSLVYSTYLGGSGDEAGNAIVVDATGSAYVTGTTSSNNFPVLGAFQATPRGGNEAFVVKLDPTGSTLVYSTYIGSNTDDVANGIAIDGLGNAYITGSTLSSTFPNNSAVICLGVKSTGSDAFVLRLNATGATVDYCRFIGGSGIDIGQSIAADAAGNVWVTGTTTSPAIGVVNALQPSLAGNIDAFIGKLDPLGAILYLTYLGGTGDDEAFAIAVDSLGNAYVAGSTTSTNFPLVTPLQVSLGGRHDAFVSKLSPDGSALVFSTYLGGTGEDFANGIAVNANDFSIHVVGSTASVDFPAVQPFQQTTGGGIDAFVTKLSPTGAAFVYSTYLGGTGSDVAQAVAVDLDGVAYLTGSTNSPVFPTQTPIQTATGLLDAFVTQIADGGIIQFTATGFSVSETANTAVISVQRTGDTSGQVTVEFVTSDGTATAGADYGAVLTTLTFVPGQIVTTVNVPIFDDVIGDGDETVILTLRNPSGGAVLGGRKVVNLTILENESAVNFSADNFTASETQGSALITVNRAGPVTGTVTVEFSTADGPPPNGAIAGRDYTRVAKRLITFAPGVRTQTVSVPILQDTLAEGSEIVMLHLGNQSAGTLIGRSTAMLEITDAEDKGGNLQFFTSVFSVKEPAAGQTAAALITVTRTGGSASNVTVDYQATDGPAPNGALAGTNYAPTAGTLTFGAGQNVATFTVPILGDPSVTRGNPLTVALSLTNPGGGGKLGTLSTAILNIEEFQANVAFTASQFTVAQTAASAPITVRRAGASSGPVTINFSTTTEGTTAVPDVDFRPVSGTLTFPTSNTTLTFSVPILNNPNGIGGRTVGVALTGGTGLATTVEPRTAVLTIGQVALAGVIEFSSPIFEVAENVSGGLATIGVIRGGGTLGGVTVNYATSDIGPCPPAAGLFYACAGSDYTPSQGTVTFAQGETFKTFTVPITNDGAVEGVEALNLSLSTPGPADSGARLGVRSTAQLRIVDDELAIGFSATNYTVAEAGGSVTIKVELTGMGAGVTVQYATSNGSATAGQDYIATSGTLTFPGSGTPTGVRTQTFTIPILPDTLAEGTETINLTLSLPTGGAQLITGRFTAIVAITDDEQGGSIEFDSPTYSVVEGDGVATIRVKRTAAAGGGALASGVTVDYATTDGSATAGLDYTGTAGRLTFAAGETLKTFTIPILDDTLGEGDETVNLRLLNPGGGGILGATGTAVLTIVDDDPYVSFNATAYSVVESNGNLTVTVLRGGSTAGQVTVNYTTADQRPGGTGKAVAGVDYTATSGTLTFLNGIALQTFQVPILNNAQPDPDRKFDLLLSNAVPATVTILVPTRAEVTITDDDAGGVIQFAASSYTVSETGGDAVVTVLRSGGTGGGVSVVIETGAFAVTPVAPTATANVDYTPLMTGGTSGRRVIFGQGETSKIVRIPVLADGVGEGVEQFDVKLSLPCAGAFDPVTLACLTGTFTGAPTVGPQAVAAVLIVDADQTVQFSAAEFSSAESAPAAILVVERTGPSRRLLVDFVTADLPGACPAPFNSGRACASVDYQSTTGTLTFEPGVNTQRISVPLINNQVVDIDKLFSVQLNTLRTTDGPPVVPAMTLGPRTTANVRIKEDDRGGVFSVTGGATPETNGNTTFTVTISRAAGTGGPVSVFFHARQCGAGLPTTLPATPPQVAEGCEFVALEGVDFDPIDERIVFNAGEVSKTRTIVIHGNAIPEGFRDIRVQLTEPLTGPGPSAVASVKQDNVEIGATLGGSSQLVRIQEDDLYFVNLSADTYSVSEGAREALITVVRTGLPTFLAQAQDIDIIAVTAGTGSTVPVAGRDYVDLGASPDSSARVVARESAFHFAPNETMKTFRVPLLDDDLVDGPKEFLVYIRSAVNNGTPGGPGLTVPRSARLLVIDDDAGGAIEFSSAVYTFAEDVASGLAIITLSRTGGLADMVTVQARTVEMATPPIEIAVPFAEYQPLNTTVTFNVGQPTATFAVQIFNDGGADGVKTVNLMISNPQPAGFLNQSPTLGTRTTALLRIVDAAQSVAFAQAGNMVDEGAGTALIAVDRTGDVSGVLTVDFATSDNTALNGLDYTAVTTTLTFAAGQSQLLVPVPIIDNTTVGADKDLVLTLSNPSAGALAAGRNTATLTIKDDDKGGDIAFPGASVIVQETTGQAIVTIVRTNGTAGCPLPLTVPTPPTGSCAEATYVTFSTADGTATDPGDYTSVTTVVEFGAGETQKTVMIPIVSDGPGEGTETVLLSLTNPQPSGPTVAGRAPLLGLAAATLSILETEFRVGATAYTVGEGGGPAVITVVRVGDLSGTATVDFVTADGTAVSTPSGDFTGVTSGQLTFAAQEAVKTLSVTLSDDTIAETDESFDVVFSNPVGASIARDSCAAAAPAAPALVTTCAVIVNILDNEVGGVITFAQPVFDVLEPATPTAAATITVRRTAGGAGNVTVDFTTGDDTAVAGVDYDTTTGTVTFAAGETLKTFTVPVRNGVVGVRAANLFLVNATGGATIGTPETAALRITDRDNSIGFAALGFSVTENGGPAAITVRRTGSTGTVLVDFATADQGACPAALGALYACAGSDYTATATTLTFPAGTSQLTVMVPITNDTLVEPNETFTVRLDNPRLTDLTPVAIAPESCVTLPTPTSCAAVATVVDEDQGGVIQFSTDVYQVVENVAGGQVSILLIRTGGLAGGAAVTLDTTLGTPASQTVTFTAGQPTATALLNIADNALADGDRSGALTLSNPVPALQAGSPKLGTRTTATLQVIDDEPFVFFSADTYSVGEGAGPATITVRRQGSPAATVRVDFAATDGTATPPRYTQTNGTLTFGPGIMSQTFQVTIGNDTTTQGQQSVVLTLSAPNTTGAQAAGILGTNPATLLINDDDRSGTLSFSSGSYSVTEAGGLLTVTINRSGGNAGGISVDYGVTGGTAVNGADFTVGGTGTVTFGPNEVFKTFDITPIPNPAAQGPKTIVLSLSNQTGSAVLGPPSQTTVTILDQEQTLVFSTPAYAVRENAGSAAIVINRVGPTTGTVLVDFTTINGTAVATVPVPFAQGDYTTVTRTLTFGPGVKTQTVMVPIFNDGLIEGNETFSVQMSNPRFSPVGANVGFAPGTCVTFVSGPPDSCAVTVTIGDDDLGGAIQFSQASYSVTEGAASAPITLSRTGGLGGPVTVHLTAVEAGSTTSAVLDYAPVDTVVTFNAGQASASVTVPIVNDLLAEGTETLKLQLSSPTGGAVLGARDSAVLSIVDNDLGGTIEFSAVLYTVSEAAAAATITVVRTGGTAQDAAVDFATVDATGSNLGVAGVHYLPTATAVIFNTGQTMRTVTVPLPPDNALAQGNKLVQLALSNPRGGAKLGVKSAATLKILDNEATVQLASPASSVNEGGSALITVERTGTTGTVIVSYTTANLPGPCPAPAGSGRACAGIDYTPKAGSLTFNPGVQTLTFSVPTVANARQDGNRTFTVSVLVTGGTAGAVLGQVPSATVTIVDEDRAGALAFFGAAVRGSESGMINLSVRRASATVAGPVTVNFATVDGTAKANIDYVPAAGTLTFGVGVAAVNLTVNILPNSRDDGDRTFNVVLSAPTGGATLGFPSTATVTIGDDDVGGTVQFSAANYAASECAALPCFASLTVSRTGGGASAVSVDFVTVDGTGNAINDYVATSGTVVFATNQTTQTIRIPLQIEPGAQPMKTFGVILSAPKGGAVLGVRGSATVTITDTR